MRLSRPRMLKLEIPCSLANQYIRKWYSRTSPCSNAALMPVQPYFGQNLSGRLPLEDSSDFDDSWTELIAMTWTFILDTLRSFRFSGDGRGEVRWTGMSKFWRFTAKNWGFSWPFSDDSSMSNFKFQISIGQGGLPIRPKPGPLGQLKFEIWFENRWRKTKTKNIFCTFFVRRL